MFIPYQESFKPAIKYNVYLQLGALSIFTETMRHLSLLMYNPRARPSDT